MHRTLDELVAYPPHEPRKASRTYRQTHKHLIYELDAPCWICGVRRSQGGRLETHHVVFEWASQNGLDLDKVTRDWPEITDRKRLAEWVDSESNMLVLCLPPDAAVLTPHGEFAIESLSPGDEVTCPDGVDRLIESVARTPFSGKLVDVNGRLMTSNHLVMTHRGWLPAGLVGVGDEIGEYVGMFDEDVLGLRAIKPQVLESIVMSNPVDMMYSLVGRQGSTEMLLHHPTVLHNRFSLSSHPDVTSHVSSLSPSPAEKHPVRGFVSSRQGVQRFQSAPVRTELTFGEPRFERSCAPGASLLHEPCVHNASTLCGTHSRTGRVVVSEPGNDQKDRSADQAHPLDSRRGACCHTRWSPVNKVSCSMFSGYVHDITIQGFPSFVADGLIVHNCDVHHRGKHTGVHMIDYPIWVLQRYQGDEWTFIEQPVRAHTPLFQTT